MSTDGAVVLWHRAKALQSWAKYVRSKGEEPPPELESEADLLLQAVTAGHSGSAVDALDAVVHGLGMDVLLLDYATAAERLSVSKSTVKRLVDRGVLPVVHPTGGTPRIHVEDLEDYAASLRDTTGQVETKSPAGNHRQAEVSTPFPRSAGAPGGS